LALKPLLPIGTCKPTSGRRAKPIVLSELENSFAQAVEEHREMVDCLEQGNAEHVDNILRRHIIEPMRLWDRLITPDSPFSEYFNNRGELYKNLSTIGNFYDLS